MDARSTPEGGGCKLLRPQSILSCFVLSCVPCVVGTTATMDSRMAETAHSGNEWVSVDESWSRLSDDELRKVQWRIDDPTSLPNLQDRIPDELGTFVIEYEYHLSEEDPQVPCAHCPQHQRHRHGYVLRDDRGRRFLLGSTCGPKAYGSDYHMASGSRDAAMARSKALLRWDGLSEQLPSTLVELSFIAEDRVSRVLAASRARLEKNASRIVERIRRLKPQEVGGDVLLSTTSEVRDRDEEARIQATFVKEMEALTELGLPIKEHNRRNQEAKDRLGVGQALFKSLEISHGVAFKVSWLTASSCPVTTLRATISALRALLAKGQAQDLATRALSQLGTKAARLLDDADTCVEQISQAPAFFAVDNLRRVSSWLAASGNPPGTSEVVEDRWILREPMRDAVSIDLKPFQADPSG